MESAKCKRGKMKYDIVCIGDAFEDVFVEPNLKPEYSRSFPSKQSISFELGEKVPLNEVEYEIGGSACNTSVGFSRLGFNAAIVSLLGDDTPGAKVIDRLESEGVNTGSITMRKDLKTGFSVIFRFDGERTIFVYHGVKDYKELKIKKGLHAKWIYMSPLGENAKDIESRVIEEVSEHNSKFAWNPGSLQIARGANAFGHLLKATSILFLNKDEAIKFINLPIRPSIEQMCFKLHSFGPKIVVITNGKEGAYVSCDSHVYHREANKRIVRVDATGAGDSFAVGFLGKIMELEWENVAVDEIEEALEWGMANSASVIRQIGAQRGLLKREEIEKHVDK